MAKIIIDVPDGEYCDDCVGINDWGHCFIFQCHNEVEESDDDDVDSKLIKCDECREATVKQTT